MAHKNKGQLTCIVEWHKSLGKKLSRIFWKRERLAEKKEIRKQIYESK